MHTTHIRNFIIVLVVLFVLDVIFISFIYKQFSTMIQDIQQNNKLSFRTIPAILVYPILALTLYIFIIKDLKHQQKPSLIKAGLLGFSIYATYDLTNLATISKWKWSFAVVDMMWGIVGFVFTTVISSSLIEMIDRI